MKTITDVRQFVEEYRWRRQHVPAEFRRALRTRLGVWLTNYANGLVAGEARWMGARTQKNPLDAFVYQELIYETRPNVLLELGSAWGGSALYFAHLFDLLGEGQVVTVDYSHESFEAEHPRISCVTGSTLDAEVIAAVHARCDGKRVMMIHDASHEAPVVLKDLHAYGPLVSPGCYLVVEDGLAEFISPALGGRAAPGPYDAIKDFLRESDAFELDAERHRHYATFSPYGFLRRVR